MAYIARKFGNLRFRKDAKYTFTGSSGKFHKGGSSGSGSGFKGGYKSGMVERGKIRCYTCNELGHFATECKKPKQAWKGKESYDELK